jgi:hypothetical protein
MRMTMRSFAWIGLAVLALGTGACTATMVNRPGGAGARSQYAPVNETVRTAGLVKYNNHGSESMVRSRRQDAYRQMHTACAGAYRIDAEGPREENGVVPPQPAGPPPAPTAGTSYWFIQFSCVPKDGTDVASGAAAPVLTPTAPDPHLGR